MNSNSEPGNSSSKPEEQTTGIVPSDQEGKEAYPRDLVWAFCKCVLEGRWDSVIFAYEIDSDFHKIKINDRRGTALHVAVNSGDEELVNKLVGAIIEHEGKELGGKSALRLTNERGDTPLHLAAYRGFIGMCKCIIGENGERKDLIKVRNNRGETPLFCAGLACQKQTFVYMYHASKREVDVPLTKSEGDSILHLAIQREFFEQTSEIEETEEDTVDMYLFRGDVLEGNWEDIIVAYENNKIFHKIKINESRGTALHVAVNNGDEKRVKLLVDAIINIEQVERELGGESALRLTNERGDTPLHLAAYRGFIGMCKCIIGENGERKDLIKVLNKKRETPLFCAVLTCQKQTFVYMYDVSKSEVDVPLRNHHGDSILHVAIRRGFFDLAVIIIHCYPELTDTPTEDGVTPLKTLATRPSAFKSGSNLTWWKQILYQCIIVKPLDAVKEIGSSLDKTGKVTIHIETEIKEPARTRVLPNSVTFLCSVFNTIWSALSGHRLSQLDISVVDMLCMDVLYLKTIKKIKQNHVWGDQLLKDFMKNPSGSYMGSTEGQPIGQDDLDEKGSPQPFLSQRQLESLRSKVAKKETTSPRHQKPQENKKQSTEVKTDEKDTTFLAVAKTGIVEFLNELQTKISSDQYDTIQDKESLLLVAMKNIKNKLSENIDKKETAFLTAAKNGIVEIVDALLPKIPSVVNESNSNNENALLLAVKNRQPHVVEVLHKKLDTKLFYSLIFEVDNRENTVLHLAAGTGNNNEKSWMIAGAAMQMMWDLKWYQYIKELVPEHFMFRNNMDGKTAGEIFKENHKDLVKNSSEWLKETSESCSVVAALIAGVSFATSSTVPGGTEKGKPELEGQPEFDTFAIASLIGLCFSVTALVMFLSIITSRKQAEDFRRSLPAKLLFGLSSLFVSITSLLVSFCAAHFFVLKDKYKNILFPIYVATCLPATFFAVVQFPLYVDLVKAIFKKRPQRSYRSDHL